MTFFLTVIFQIVNFFFVNSELVAGFGGRHIGSLDHLYFHNLTLVHRIYSRTVSSERLLSALMNWSKLVYGLFGQSNMNHTLHFCPGQPGRNQMYQSRSLTVLIYILWVCWSNFCSDRGVTPVLLNLFTVLGIYNFGSRQYVFHFYIFYDIKYLKLCK